MKEEVRQEELKKKEMEEEGKEIETSKEDEEQKTKLEVSDEELKKLCKERICPDCPERKTMQDQVLRIKADADNFRKRVEREKEMFCKYATEKVLEDLLPIIDNLELAVQHGRQVEGCKDLVQGVEMTVKMFMDTLKRHGLEKIETKEGDRFDPSVHEALAEEERDDMEAGMVSKVMQGGYRIRDRVLRPAKVFVSKKIEKN